MATAPFRAYEGDQPYVFISYSHKDSPSVFPVIKEMNDAGYRVWYDEGIAPGTEWPASVEDHLVAAGMVLVFLSPQAVNSENVRNEINLARGEKKRILVVYLEETRLLYGLKLQLNSLQSIRYDDYKDFSAFLSKMEKQLEPFKGSIAQRPRAKVAAPATAASGAALPADRESLRVGASDNLLAEGGGRGGAAQKEQLEAFFNGKGAPVEGAIEWQVLDIDAENNCALVVTRDCVAKKPYHQPGGAITWEDCTLRKWLNQEFYDGLPLEVKSRTVKVVNQNPDNPYYGTPGGNPTYDRVFLLSQDEAKDYLKSSSNLVARFRGAGCWWWLRSPGFNAGYAADVDDGGYVYGIGVVVDYVRGVRPALWLSL